MPAEIARALVDYGARCEPPAGGVPPSPEGGARTARPAAAAPPPLPLADTTNNPFLRRKPPPRAEPAVVAMTVAPEHMARSVERGPPAAAAPPRPPVPAPRRPSFVGRPPSLDGGDGRSPLKPPPGLDLVPRSPPRALAAVAAAAVAVPAARARRGPPQPQQPQQQPLPAPADRKRKAGVEAPTSAAPAKRPAAAVAGGAAEASTSAPPPPATTRAVAHFRHVAKPPRATRGKATATRDNFVRINLRGGGGGSAKQRYIGRMQQHVGARGGGARARARLARRPPTLPHAGVGAELADGGGGAALRCFKCGAGGHFAAECGGLLADGSAAPPPSRAPLPAPALPPPPPPLPPNASLDDVEAIIASAFGFSGFRGRQRDVVARVLAPGSRTLAILPTGAGKSLCYAAPALVRPGTVLVVTPLVALARDQLAHLPPCLPAAVLASDAAPAETRATLAALAAGSLRVLFVAPERLASPALAAALHPLLPLSLVCIDEAHCAAEWGHNFRPAYFRLARLLPPHTSLLALTATATPSTAAAVATSLGIDPGTGIIRDGALPSRLRLSASRVAGGVGGVASRRALVAALAPGGRLAASRRAIVYVPFQVAADGLAAALQAARVRAAAYHAGLPNAARAAAAADLASGRVRVVVATVAFGMGVDISEIDAIVHAGLPRSVEEYVQQVGRAARDGAGGNDDDASLPPALCHAFVDDGDYRRLRSLAASDGAAPPGVARLLDAVYSGVVGGAKGARGAAASAPPPPPPTPTSPAPVHRVLPLDPLALAADARREAVETLLAYVEADEEGALSLGPRTAHAFTVAFFKTAPATLAAGSPVVAAVLAVCARTRGGAYRGRTDSVAARARVAPATLMSELASLASCGEVALEVDPTPSACVTVTGPPPAGAERRALADRIASRHAAIARGGVARLDAVYRMLSAAAADGADATVADAAVRAGVERYFGPPDETTDATTTTSLPLRPTDPALATDVRWLLGESRARGGPPMGALAAARVLHGVSSPAHPAAAWATSPVWGRHAHVDFEAVVAAAEEAVRAVMAGGEGSGAGEEVGGDGTAPRRAPPRPPAGRGRAHHGARSFCGGAKWAAKVAAKGWRRFG